MQARAQRDRAPLEAEINRLTISLRGKLDFNSLNHY